MSCKGPWECTGKIFHPRTGVTDCSHSSHLSLFGKNAFRRCGVQQWKCTGKMFLTYNQPRTVRLFSFFKSLYGKRAIRRFGVNQWECTCEIFRTHNHPTTGHPFDRLFSFLLTRVTHLFTRKLLGDLG